MSLPAGSPRDLFAWILGTATMGGRSVKTGITGTPAMTGVVGFTGAGWLSHRGFCGWGNQDHRSCCCCSLAPCGHGCHCSGEARLVLMASQMLLGSLGCRLSCYSGGGGEGDGLGEPGPWAPPLLLSWTHLLCVSQSTHLQMFKCLGYFSILGCWVKAPLPKVLGYWHFVGYRLARRDKDYISFCHDDDITVQNSVFLCCPAYHSFVSWPLSFIPYLKSIFPTETHKKIILHFILVLLHISFIIITWFCDNL